MDILISIIILLFSAIVHEVSHGLMAEKLGDDTAREEGRITLNPIPHIDPFGSILLPALMWFATNGQFVFGAAKPVPVNFGNLRNPRSGMALVSLAGPLSNFALAILFVLPIKLGLASAIAEPILIKAILINLLLGVFNLIPIPPLDGSKIIASFLPQNLMTKLLEFERYGFIVILIFLYTGLLNTVFIPVVLFFVKIFNINIF